MNHATPVPFLRRFGAERSPRSRPLDAGDFGTEFGMEIYLSQRSLSNQVSASGVTHAAGHWLGRLVRRMRRR